jgi:hypothetical protein
VDHDSQLYVNFMKELVTSENLKGFFTFPDKPDEAIVEFSNAFPIGLPEPYSVGRTIGHTFDTELLKNGLNYFSHL